jgi:hypothetical protein
MKEDIIFTADPQEMQGKYVLENLYRFWKEVEEKTDPKDGHKFNAEVEKKEIILERGKLLDSENIQVVQFHLQTGDIKGIYCSAIQRRATLATPPAWQKPWKIQLENSVKPTKHTVILYAKTVADALAIVTEYMERTYDGTFTFKSVGNFDNATFVAPEPRELKDGEKAPELKFYQISVSARWRDDDDTQNGVIVLQAENVDAALVVIERIIRERREKFVADLKKNSEDKERIKKETDKLKAGFILTLNEAKKINCTDIVPKELSNAFYPDDRK